MQEYEKLNQILDEAINEVLQETTDHFRLQNDSFKEPDYESLSKNSDRFQGFGNTKHFQSPGKFNPNENFPKQPTEPNTSSLFEKPSAHQHFQYPAGHKTNENNYESFGQPQNEETVENPYYKTFQKIRNQQRHGNPNHPPFEPDKERIYRKQVNQETFDRPSPSQNAYKSNSQSFQKPKSQTFGTPTILTDENGLYAQKPDGYERVYSPKIVSRNEWGALPPLGNLNPMKHPASVIMFSLNTGTPACSSQKECTRTVRELQAKHMGEGLPDIQYNFLMGGDGNLYEGRGWHVESGIKKGTDDEKVNLNVAFIGDYHQDTSKIPPAMLGPVQDLIMFGNIANLLKGGLPKEE